MKTKLYLLEEIDLDSKYSNTLKFDTIEAQATYFDSKVSAITDGTLNYSYFKENTVIKISKNIDDILNINYLMYTNPEAKTYYAFITSKEYINDTVTALTIITDVMQTFMFDYELSQCFVEREHQDRVDTSLAPIYNTVDENLDYGKNYSIDTNNINEDTIYDNDLNVDVCWYEIIMTEELSSGTFDNTDNTTYCNLSQRFKQYNNETGLYCYLLPFIPGKTTVPYNRFYISDSTGTEVLLNSLSSTYLTKNTAVISIRVLNYSPVKYTLTKKASSTEYINEYLLEFIDGAAIGPTFTSVGCRPISMTANVGGIDYTSIGGNILNLAQVTEDNDNIYLEEIHRTSTGSASINGVFSTYSKWQAYVLTHSNDIKELYLEVRPYDYFESKLDVYPYKYLAITDYKSDPLIIKNELIDELHDQSKLYYEQSLGLQTKNIIYVKGGDAAGKYFAKIDSSVCEKNLITDAYISYMATNKAAATTGVALSVAQSAASVGLGLATGGIGLAVAGSQAISTAGMIGQTMIKKQDLRTTPDSIRSQGNNSDFDLMLSNTKLVNVGASILEEYKNKIWEYLYHYGYRCNEIKTPDIDTRYYFNYLKTIACQIKCNLSNEIREKIKENYNNGITIWHYRDSTTFKGINDYTYENEEMSIINS